MSWPKFRLEKLVKISKGKKHTLAVKKTSTRYIQIDDLRNDNLVKFTNDEVGVFVESKDVIIAWDGANAGTIGYGLEGLIGSTLARLSIVNPDVDTVYLARFLQSKFREIRDNCTGATIPHVSRPHLNSLKVPLPPLDEQKRISGILEKADTIRHKRHQATQFASDLLRNVFLDIFGDPVTNPKDWEVKPIKCGVESIKSGWSAKGQSYPCQAGEKGVLKISAVTSGTFKPSENKFVDTEIIPEGKNLLFPNEGDLLFSRANTRELVAATCIVTESREDVFLPDKLWKIKTLENELLPEFLHFMVQQPKFKDRLTSQATGTSGSMLNISKAKFEESLAIYPPIEKQLEFKKLFWKLNKINSSINTSEQHLNDAFNSLSLKAFSGEL